MITNCHCSEQRFSLKKLLFVQLKNFLVLQHQLQYLENLEKINYSLKFLFRDQKFIVLHILVGYYNFY